MNDFVSQKVGAKAARLVCEKRVTPLDALTFKVEGDHDTYLVVLENDAAFCTCPSTDPACSHVRAARFERGEMLERAKVGAAYDDPFAGLVD